MRLGVAFLVALAALAVVPLAEASFIVDRNVNGVSLRISGGTAIVNYLKAGASRSVTLSGAINARPPSSQAQVSFKVRYASKHQAGGACLPYDGPSLPYMVAACKAPDGSYWALQSWQRLVPNY